MKYLRPESLEHFISCKNLFNNFIKKKNFFIKLIKKKGLLNFVRNENFFLLEREVDLS